MKIINADVFFKYIIIIMIGSSAIFALVNAIPEVIASDKLISNLSPFHNFLTNESTTYSNSIYGVSIKYPHGWEKVEKNEQTNYQKNPLIVFLSPKEKYLSRYPAMLSVSVYPWTSLHQYAQNSINNIKTHSDFRLVGSNNITISNHPAYKIFYQHIIPTEGSDSIENITKIFVEGYNSLYNITYITQESSQNYSDYLKIGKKMIDSFDISFARTFNPPIIINGIVENGEWKCEPISFSLVLINRTELQPTTYNITLCSIGDDKNLYLMGKIKGPSTFKDGSKIMIVLNQVSGKHGYPDIRTDPIKDILRIYLTAYYTGDKGLFEDGYMNKSNNSFQVDTKNGGTQNGFAGISISNGSQTFEINHPLCSGDKNDVCVSPDSPIRFSFNFDTTDDSAFWPGSNEGILFYANRGFVLDNSLLSPLTHIISIPSTYFIWGPFERMNTTATRSVYLKVLTPEEQDAFMKKPTANLLIKILLGVSHDDLVKLLRLFNQDELDGLSKILQMQDAKGEVLNRLNLTERSEIFK